MAVSASACWRPVTSTRSRWSLAVGLSFSQTKRDLLECFGARLIGKEMLMAGATPKDVVMHHLDNQVALGKSYFYTDQFNNPVGIEAHRYQTASETWPCN